MSADPLCACDWWSGRVCEMHEYPTTPPDENPATTERTES